MCEERSRAVIYSALPHRCLLTGNSCYCVLQRLLSREETLTVSTITPLFMISFGCMWANIGAVAKKGQNVRSVSQYSHRHGAMTSSAEMQQKFTLHVTQLQEILSAEEHEPSPSPSTPPAPIRKMTGTLEIFFIHARICRNCTLI